MIKMSTSLFGTKCTCKVKELQHIVDLPMASGLSRLVTCRFVPAIKNFKKNIEVAAENRGRSGYRNLNFFFLALGILLCRPIYSIHVSSHAV